MRPTQLEQIVDQRGQTIRLDAQHAVIAGDGFGIGDHTIFEGLDHDADRREGRAEVV